jgi:hypothetical protein
MAEGILPELGKNRNQELGVKLFLPRNRSEDVGGQAASGIQP